MDTGLENLMNKLSAMQLEVFKERINVPEMSRKQYIVEFLKIFLGEQSIIPNILELSDEEFDEECHETVENKGLLEPESDFFHEMIDMEPDNKTSCVEQWTKIFHKIDLLDKCDLSKEMIKCLDASKNLKIIFDQLIADGT
jgi:hypothetical protein